MENCLKAIVSITCLTIPSLGEGSVNGPLRVSETNPRYFTDDSGEAIYLTGSHTWNNLVEIVPEGEDTQFDYDGYLQFLRDHNHNFFRLWCWDLINWDTRADQSDGKMYEIYPKPWLRTGPDNALDGNPKFDLTEFNPEYFKRLRDRVKKAEEQNIYASVMLFDGWGMQFLPNAFANHPFHPDNNVNNIELETEGDPPGVKIYEVENTPVFKLQMLYVRKVVETVNAFDNVLYEVSNENHGESTDWQYSIIEYIRFLEAKTGKHHPIGMTFQWKGGSDHTLFNSPADWISPGRYGTYKDDPPPGDGRKVVLPDTDHLWGIGGDGVWVWKSFLRGLNPIFMDPYDLSVLSVGQGPEWRDEINVAMGNTRLVAGAINLIEMVPSMTIASSEYCLYAKGKEYLVYLPEGKDVEINLTEEKGVFEVNWIHPVTLKQVTGGTVTGGARHRLSAPYDADGALVHLKVR